MTLVLEKTDTYMMQAPLRLLKRITPKRIKQSARLFLESRGVFGQTAGQEIITDLNRLDEKLRELDRALEVSDDFLRKQFQTFRMDFSKDVPADPYSDEYRRKQFTLYEAIAGKPYTVKNEVTLFDVPSAVISPFPFLTKSASTVGNHLISIGFLIRTLALPPGAKILELGMGWGNTTEFLARMGYQVTAVDIDERFVQLVGERASRASLDINVIHDDFSYIEKTDELFDALLFFECFHHASDHLRIIQSFEKVVKKGGIVVFAAEPIAENFPLPWGLRMDGESLWAIRKHGWLELGFKESYFRKTLGLYGWDLTKYSCPETPFGTIFIAKRKSDKSH